MWPSCSGPELSSPPGLLRLIPINDIGATSEPCDPFLGERVSPFGDVPLQHLLPDLFKSRSHAVSSERVGVLAVIAAEFVFSGKHHGKSLLVVSANPKILAERLAQMRLGHARGIQGGLERLGSRKSRAHVFERRLDGLNSRL